MLSEKAHERNCYLMPDELAKIVNACQQTTSKYYLPAIILLGAEHGASKQEVLSLKWHDIKFDYEGKGLIRFFRTKNNHERTVHLMPRTREALRAWRKHLEEMRMKRNTHVKDDTYVFCRLDAPPLKGFTSGWRKVRKLAGFDDLHCEIKMTDRYTHLTDAGQASLQEKPAHHYNGVNPAAGSTPSDKAS